MDKFLATLAVIVIAVFYTALITLSIVRENEREFACVGLGYDGYRNSPRGCYVGTDPIMVYPYKTVFDRIE